VTGIPAAVAEPGQAPALARIAAVPNPVMGSAEIRFTLPSAGWTRLLLFDSAGRCVRTVQEGILSAGPHVISWDGNDDKAARLPAGVYFARLEGVGALRSTKVVLLDP
jgi:hypothetical protein